MYPVEMTIDQSTEIRDKSFSGEPQFYKLYPSTVLSFSTNHWTPITVARKAADFLAAEKGARVLDIGSGIGNFCLSGAHYHPAAFFTGVEQRGQLVEYAEKARQKLGMSNVAFIHGNFTEVDFSRYDHFYFYNSFYENIAVAEKLDETIPHSIERYNKYSYCLFKLLDKKPSGTRVATFYSMDDQMPPRYHICGSDIDDLLKFWVKE
jgi:hypothetical protein